MEEWLLGGWRRECPPPSSVLTTECPGLCEVVAPAWALGQPCLELLAPVGCVTSREVLDPPGHSLPSLLHGGGQSE